MGDTEWRDCCRTHTQDPSTKQRPLLRTAACLPWQKARASCVTGGGDLVVVDSAAKNTVVGKYVASFSDYSSCNLPHPFIGGFSCGTSSRDRPRLISYQDDRMLQYDTPDRAETGLA